MLATGSTLQPAVAQSELLLPGSSGTKKGDKERRKPLLTEPVETRSHGLSHGELDKICYS